MGRRWGASGLRSEDVFSFDRIERLTLPKGESLNAIRAPRRRARRGVIIPQPLQSQPPYILLYERRRLVAVLQLLAFGFTETCKDLFAAQGFAGFGGHVVWSLRCCWYEGRGIEENAAPGPTEARCGQGVSLSL